ncbi:hypothetical protein LCGC14_2029500 [marine sediment metagenome]|uniref:Uncharacterized protein n=1 Tax=marine sediment metagenome TaxID=412755 RepID=A0A0F9EV84_9ZZZZ
MTTELFLIVYVPLSILLIANAWLFVLNYRWQKLLQEKVDSLVSKINLGMAGILELGDED